MVGLASGLGAKGRRVGGDAYVDRRFQGVFVHQLLGTGTGCSST